MTLPGRLSYYFSRMQVWMGRASFLGVMYLTAEKLGVSLWLALLAAVIGGAVLVWVDSRFIVESENTEAIERSPVWAKFLNEWNEFYTRSRG